MNGADTAIHPPAFDRGADALRVRLGMWIFITSELLLFAGLLLAYGVARWHAPDGFVAASARTERLLGTLNTAILLSSSAAIALASDAAARQRAAVAARWLAATATLGAIFLLVKALEYHREWGEGLFPGAGFAIDGHPVPGAELFFAWYYLATALHALHLAVGVVICTRLALRCRSRPAETSAHRVPALALYWHFVDAVWVLLFPLIYLVTPT